MNYLKKGMWDLNNDNFNYINEKPDFLENQQFNPGENRRSPESPNRSGPPLTSPPNFIPEAPRAGEQPFSGTPGYSTQFRGGGQNQSRNFWGCVNRFTYIWLVNGDNFWFYPVFIGWQQMEGFRWRNGRWVYDRINLRRILFFRCF